MSHAPTHPAPEQKSYPHNFRRIRLELAREKGHPEGSARDGYILILPLDDQSRIDVDAWKEHRDLCRIVRFREGEEDELGRLQRKQGGGWAFHYSSPPNVEDERALHLESDQFVIGDYVAIREEKALHTFQVASVDYV
ncbi:hypothetical protein RZS28_10630 [Methylocapsa polymorpha]|uniref:Uncharacterized protein n=1 Tax=Methylocapsa polymorpha TaxID=3080828 RepID=A0ABZ0HLX5_9HYPH|nr:hypothetical protein RZS28_10630 [Methylocapsa sp. RX1]